MSDEELLAELARRQAAQRPPAPAGSMTSFPRTARTESSDAYADSVDAAVDAPATPTPRGRCATTDLYDGAVDPEAEAAPRSAPAEAPSLLSSLGLGFY
jgi:hypothetical protein